MESMVAEGAWEDQLCCWDGLEMRSKPGLEKVAGSEVEEAKPPLKAR